jgi:hypothetical protein
VVIGCTSRVAAPNRISDAERRSASGTGAERHLTPAFSAISSMTPRVVPGSSFQEFGGVRSSWPMTTCTLDALASVSCPSRSRMVSVAPSSTASWRNSTLASSDTDLMSHRAQRVSSAVTAGKPFSRAPGRAVGQGDANANTVRGTSGSGA